MNSIWETLKKYIQSRFDLFKLEMEDEIAKAFAILAKLLALMALLFLMVFFLSIALAYFINESVEHKYMGFLIVGSFYMILFLIAFIRGKNFILDNNIVAFIEKQFRKKDDGNQ